MQKNNFGNFSDKKIVILGFGQEGQDNYLALRKLFPKKPLAIADKKELADFGKKAQQLLIKDKFLKLHLGSDYLKALKRYNVVVKTPGIPNSALKGYLERNCLLTTQTEIFFDYFKGKIIGVTGTKGKGTTASLIFSILKTAGFQVKLVGNIGQPVFQLLLKAKPNQVFVYELSSHQLQGLKKSPYIAVFLNLFTDHLDYYRDLAEYQKAKESIVLYQGPQDFIIFNQDDPVVAKMAAKSRARKIPFFKQQLGQVTDIVAKKDIPLKGDFNLLNVLAAIRVAQVLGVPLKVIQQGIRAFKPLPHRLQYVGTYQGRQFYNDSMATVPKTAQLAIEAMGAQLATVILGGSRKGDIDFSGLAQTILESPARTLILFPQTGEEIWEAVIAWYQKGFQAKRSLPQAFYTYSMREAVAIAYQQTNKGEICLLAPASASFSLFRDYKHRGKLFVQYVKSFGKKTN